MAFGISSASVSAASAAAPKIVEQVPLTVEQTTATLRAVINPEGKATTYRFEYGKTPALGKRIPSDHESFVGSGTEPVSVEVSLENLSEGTVYHYRFVAVNADGTTVGETRQFSTLNEEGLAWGRRFELVSPIDKGGADAIVAVGRLPSIPPSSIPPSPGAPT